MSSGNQHNMNHKVQEELQSIEKQIPQAKYPDITPFYDLKGVYSKSHDVSWSI